MNINHVFSAFSFISLILGSVPFPSHLQAGNTGTCIYMAWVALANFVFFVNSILWDGNVVNWAPVWCDITARMAVAFNIAIPAAGLCIQQRLYYIISDPVVAFTSADKRRSIITDLLIGLGLPILNVMLSVFIQGGRYDVYEDIGCFPALMNTALCVVLLFLWPIVIGLVTGIYCSLNIYHLMIKRHSIRSLLASSAGVTNLNIYLRLMFLSAIDLFSTVPLAAWSLWVQVTTTPLVPYPGLKRVSFTRVDQIPAALWQSDPANRSEMELSRWSSVMCALIFFIFFGFAEARKYYMVVWQATNNMSEISFKKKSSSKSPESGSQRLPAFPKASIKPSNSLSLHGLSVFGSSNTDEDSSELSYPQIRSNYTV